MDLLATDLCKKSCPSLHSSSAVRLPAVVVLLQGKEWKDGKFFSVRLDGVGHADGQKKACASDKCMDQIVS